MKNAFFVFGITNFQDMLPLMIDLLKNGEDLWLCVFDVVYKKKQFYQYENCEIENYINSIFDQIKSSGNYKLNIYRENNEKDYEVDYRLINPEIIFIQAVYHRYAKWFPNLYESKIVYLPWGLDGIRNLERSKINKKNIILNVMRHKEDKDYFTSETKIKSIYFGRIWDDYVSLSKEIKNVKDYNLPNTVEKICFIPESWLTSYKDNCVAWNHENVKSVNDCLKFLKKNGYFTIVKKREKGYPYDKVNGFTNYISEKPDLIVKKDLYFPSSLFYLPMISDINLAIGYKTQGTLEFERYCVKNKFNFFYFENIQKLEEKLCKSHKKSVSLNEDDIISRKINEYINENLC